MFELVFAGGVGASYRRSHATYEAAEAEALRLLARMKNRAAHPAIIYGPGCGRDGRSIF
jgi:4-hydroxy-3-methylbut-2-en-1-yl diphosphate synthase IspG/GcpE